MSADGPPDGLQPRVVAVVATRNRLWELKRTVAALLAEPCVAVVVVDNGSDDGTRDWLNAQSDPRLVPVFPRENLGGAGGFELGMHVARVNLSPDWVVVMDDDARPLPGAISAFAGISRAGWDMVSAAVYYPDGHICEMNRPALNPFWHPRELLATALKALVGRGRSGFHLPDAEYARPAPVEIDVGSFVGMFISARVMEGIGLPDGKLFIYGDDTSYSLRARKAGFRIGFAPQVVFEHNCSTFTEQKLFRPLWKVYYNFRNGLLSYRLAAGLAFWLVAPVVLLKWVAAARRYGVDRRVYLHILRRALRDGFLNRCDVPHDEVLAMVDAAILRYRGPGGRVRD